MVGERVPSRSPPRSAVKRLTVSIVNDGTLRTELTLPAVSVTVMVQLEYVPSASALNVTVVLPLTAEVVADEQEPP